MSGIRYGRHHRARCHRSPSCSPRAPKRRGPARSPRTSSRARSPPTSLERSTHRERRVREYFEGPRTSRQLPATCCPRYSTNLDREREPTPPLIESALLELSLVHVIRTSPDATSLQVRQGLMSALRQQQ